jgi:malonate transporter MadL subunit
MNISGVALLALCTLIGQVLGESLGYALGVKANVGGVGIAMLLLIMARIWLHKRGLLSSGVNQGVTLWGSLYIPIVVAMAAQQDVVAAVKGGPMVVLGGIGVVAMCFAMVAFLGRLAGPTETMDQIEEREAREFAAAAQSAGQIA